MRVTLVFALALFAAGCARREPVLPVAAASPPATNGANLYAQHCLSCHMADGGGVPNLQPSLIDSLLAPGDPGALLALILRGSAGQPAPNPEYQNVMPGFGFLSDAEIAALATHLRKNFGHAAPPVSPADVAAARAQPPSG